MDHYFGEINKKIGLHLTNYRYATSNPFIVTPKPDLNYEIVCFFSVQWVPELLERLEFYHASQAKLNVVITKHIKLLKK